MTTNNEKWMEEFDERERTVWQFSGPHEIYKKHTREMVKSFISKVRQEAIEEKDREIREWIDTVKKDVPSKMDDSLYPVVVDSYNQALSDLLSFLNKGNRPKIGCCSKCHGYYVEPQHQYFPLCNNNLCDCHILNTNKQS